MNSLQAKIIRLSLRIYYTYWYSLRCNIRDATLLLPTWSTLRTLGQSRLLKMTVIAPFIGTLIIFNDNLVSMLMLSPAIVGRWAGIEASPAVAKAFTLSRLQLTYFGLVFLGAAAFIFSILCPREIKRFSTSVDFIEFEKTTMTLVRTGQMMETVAKDYLRIWGAEDKFGLLQELAYPFWLMDTFHVIFQKLGEKVFWNDAADEAATSEAETGESLGEHISDGFVTERGDVDVANLAQTVATRPRVSRAIWSQIDLEAQNEIVDILLLRYQALDYRYPLLRLVVAMLYLLGFLALSWPTVHTFYLVARRATGI